MNRTSPRPSAAILLSLLAGSFSSRASFEVDLGSTLYQTDPDLTSFFGVPFEGVPLGTFDFSGSVGVRDVGLTDTIVRRLEDASVAGPGLSDTVATAVDAFQLRTVGPASILNGPLGIYYLTLQSLRGGPVSTGTLTLAFGPEGDPHGTFSSSFSLFVDVRFGSLDGPILDSRFVDIADSGSTPWGHVSPGSLAIEDVNYRLDGTGTDHDFWMQGTVVKETPNGTIGVHATQSVPDGSGTWMTLGVASLGLGLLRRCCPARV